MLVANKVMRMGSFAYRATQFFENLGKKSSSKRKTSSLSSATEGPDLNVRIGIQEESSLSSASIGMPVSPSSDAASPVFDESFRHSAAFSSPSSAELPPVPSSPLPPINNIKHEGMFVFAWNQGVFVFIDIKLCLCQLGVKVCLCSWVSRCVCVRYETRCVCAH